MFFCGNGGGEIFKLPLACRNLLLCRPFFLILHLGRPDVFGAAFLTLMPEWVEFFDTYKDFVHGGILVLVLMFLPQGLITGLTDMVRVRLALRRREHAAA